MSDPAPQPAAGRKPLSRSEAARHASLVRWGKEQPFAARLAAVREARKKGKGRGRAAKPKVDRAAEREKEQAANRQAVMGEFGSFGRQTLPGLEALSSGGTVDDAQARSLEMSGLAERVGADGTLVLTSEGKQLFRAASAADVGAAKEAIARGEARVGKQQERDKAKAEKEKAKAEKPKGGGGGGGKPTEDEKDQAKAEERAKTATATATSVGMGPEELDALRTATDTGGANSPALAAAGLIGPDGSATDQGRRALSALERGDIRQYRAALQDAAARQGREGAARTRATERETARGEREAERQARDTERRTRQADADARRAQRDRERADDRARRNAPKPRTRSYVEVKVIPDDIEAIIVAAEAEVKAGAVLNQANAEALVDAYEALDAARERIGDVLERAGLLADEEGEAEVEGGEVEMLEDEVKTTAPTADSYVGAYGSEVKALGDGDRIGGYAVLFGDANTTDLSEYRDYFTKSTDFWLDHFGWPRPMTYHHGFDAATKDAPVVGHWMDAHVDDVGVWMEGELNRAHKYYGAVKELARRGYLKLSSDSVPQWVQRQRQPNGAHEIKRWPLISASPTVTPAEPRMAALSFKALLAELGLEGIDGTEATPPDDAREGADHALKADAEHARRLLVELDILALEATAP